MKDAAAHYLRSSLTYGPLDNRDIVRRLYSSLAPGQHFQRQHCRLDSLLGFNMRDFTILTACLLLVAGAKRVTACAGHHDPYAHDKSWSPEDLARLEEKWGVEVRATLAPNPDSKQLRFPKHG
jgi:hypothetical protein